MTEQAFFLFLVMLLCRIYPFLNLGGDERKCINLPMRMRYRNTDHIAFVFKNQNIIHFGSCCQLSESSLPKSYQQPDVFERKFCKSLGVFRMIQHYVALTKGLLDPVKIAAFDGRVWRRS